MADLSTRRPGATISPGTTAHAAAPDLRRIPALDGLRVLAALGVVVYHSMGAVLGANPIAGVIIPPAAFTFFVISGFVIHRPFAAADLLGTSPPPSRAFWVGRAARVLPLWWAAVLAYVLVQGDPLRGVGEWAATLALLQYVVPDARYAVVGPAWALSVEWIFYLVAPLLALAIRQAHRYLAPEATPERVHGTVIGSLTALCAAVAPLRPFVAILIGMGFGVVDATRRVRRRNPSWLPRHRLGLVSVVATVAGWLALARYPYREGLSVQWVEQDLALLALWITIAVAWFLPVALGPSRRPVNRWLGGTVAVAAGQLTFGIYLWHDLILQRTVRVLGLDARVWAVAYLTLLGAIGLAVVTHHLIERPCLGLRRRLVPDGHATEGTEGTAATVVPGPGWIGSIDGIRVVAACCVVVFHVGAERHVPGWASQALAAICIPVFSTFFVVSGFVLYRPWARAQARVALGDGRRPTRAPDGGITNFYLRRALRVYPVYWLVQSCALALGGTAGISGFVDWFQIVTLFPLPDYDMLIHHGLGVIVWTMIFELAFYLVLPLIGRVTLRAAEQVGFVAANAVPLGALLAIFAVLGSTVAPPTVVACCIVTGMMIAAVDAWQRATRRWAPGVRPFARDPLIAVPVTVVAWAVGTAVSRNDDPELLFRTYLPVHLAAMLAVSTAMFLPAVFSPSNHPYRRFLSSRSMRVLGPLTFGVYLWHYPVIRQTGAWVPLPLPLLGPWALFGAVAMASLTHRLVERPLEHFGHHRLGRTSSSPATSPSPTAAAADRSPP